MMPKVSQTLVALREIRDGLKALERRQTETEVRLAAELGGVTRAVTEVRDLLRDRLDDRRRVDEHERRIRALERAIRPRSG